MKKMEELQCRWRTAAGLLTLVLALLAGLFAERFTLVSHAESEAKVTASSVKLRKEPSTSSESLGSAAKDAKISIKAQTTGSDGYTWYQVYVDANTLGYVRSDLVEITDGSTPSTVTPPTTPTAAPATPTTSTPDQELVPVTAVNPTSASITGGQPVRVRQNASTSSRIITTAENGLALTIIGTAVGTDSKDWYQVNFISNGSEVSGFIRADYVSVSGELTPVGTETPAQPEEPADVVEPAPETEKKDWDTYFEGEKWHLVNTMSGEAYDIEDIFKISADNKKVAEDALASKKTQQIIIIILVILLIGLAALVSYLIFKLRDMADAAYFNEVERNTVRRRTADRPQGGGQRVMQTVGADRRPVGQRPVGNGSGQGQRPIGNNGGGQGQRPVGSKGGGQGQRPVGSNGGGQGQRPVGNNGGGQGQRPVGNSGQGQRPVGNNGQGPRPVGSGGQGQRPVRNNGGGQGQRPASRGQRPMAAPVQQERAAQEQGWKSKNFIAEEDEFKFFDWDGEEE